MLLDSVAKVVVGCDAKDIWDGFYEEVILIYIITNKFYILSQFISYIFKNTD